MDDSIVVTIKCLTYNHAQYIRNALDGMLMQKTNFSFEITIHDDASDDGTEEILREYERNYPDLIRVSYEKENQFSKGTVLMDELLPTARGRYVAWCEGDDFWFDPQSLNNSIEYLESHPDCLMTVGNGLVYDCRTQSFWMYNQCMEERDLSARDIIVEQYGGYPTAGMVYRRECEYPADSFYARSGIGDLTFRMNAFAKEGKIHYFSRPACVYRFCHPGSWNEITYGDFSNAFHHVWELVRLFRDYNIETKGVYKDELMARTWKSIMHLFSFAATDQLSAWNDLVGEYGQGYELYSEELRRVYEAYRCGMVLDEWLIENAKSSRYVYIFGTGYYAGILEENVRRAGIVYEGFLLSDDSTSSESEFRNKPVKRLRDIEGDDKSLVLIASNPDRWLEITDLLKERKICNYCHPFMYDFEKI